MATGPTYKVGDICVCRFMGESQCQATVLAIREECGRTEYFVQFKGWSACFNQWKPESDILFKCTLTVQMKSGVLTLTVKKQKPVPEKKPDKSSFPLLRLPYLASAHILKMMDMDEILLLSLASTRAFCLVKFIRYRVFDISIEVENGAKIHGKSTHGPFIWYFNRKIHSTEKEWLAHFFEVCREPRVNKLMFFQEIENFLDFEQVNNNLKKLFFVQPVRLAFCKKVLKVFPLAQKIVLLEESAQLSSSSSSKLFQFLIADFNFASFRNDFTFFPSTRRLENFLASNSKCIQTQKYSFMSNRRLNTFLKFWIDGTVGRNLRVFGSVPCEEYIRGVYNPHVILDGIQHQTAPANRRKEFETVNGIISVIGGIDIVANDGTIATLKIAGGFLVCFHFFVWN